MLGAYENAKADYVVHHCAPAYRFAYANNMAVRTSVFEELGLFREWQRAADSELVHRLASERPDLRLVYRPSMRVTHLEFLRVRDRVRRLSLYTETNSRISTFRELRIRRAPRRAAAPAATTFLAGIRENALLGDPRQLAEPGMREHRRERQVDVELPAQANHHLHGDE